MVQRALGGPIHDRNRSAINHFGKRVSNQPEVLRPGQAGQFVSIWTKAANQAPGQRHHVKRDVIRVDDPGKASRIVLGDRPGNAWIPKLGDGWKEYGIRLRLTLCGLFRRQERRPGRFLPQARILPVDEQEGQFAFAQVFCKAGSENIDAPPFAAVHIYGEH